MSIKNTVFGRHVMHELCKSVHIKREDDYTLELNAPNDGYIIKHTAKFLKANDSCSYMTIQQLNNCDSCIITKMYIGSYKNYSNGCFSATQYLVSYDTVICEVEFNINKKHETRIVIGSNWNYSPTTVQHTYKFLRRFGITNISINDMYKKDIKKLGYESYTDIPITNNVGNTFYIRFSSSRAIPTFKYNNAYHIIEIADRLV